VSSSAFDPTETCASSDFATAKLTIDARFAGREFLF
jgi:hypothetical protein